MSSILGHIEPDYLELFALEFLKFAEYDFVYTLSSTNINQSAPHLVQMCVIIRYRMSLIMDLIEPELSELSALELKKLPYLISFAVSANTDQSVANLDTMYMSIRSQMSLIIGQIKPEHPELFALESDFFYTLALTNQHQTWSKCV